MRGPRVHRRCQIFFPSMLEKLFPGIDLLCQVLGELVWPCWGWGWSWEWSLALLWTALQRQEHLWPWFKNCHKHLSFRYFFFPWIFPSFRFLPSPLGRSHNFGSLTCEQCWQLCMPASTSQPCAAAQPPDLRGQEVTAPLEKKLNEN